MSRPSEPYLWRNPKTGHAHIGAKYTDKIGGQGPLAEVWVEGPWLHIQTCPYEGSVMVLANTLPLLIKELRKLEKAKP
jgi:hypothetical protein